LTFGQGGAIPTRTFFARFAVRNPDAVYLLRWQAVDPVALLVSVLLMVLAVGAASLGPSRRAVRVDPTTMLRADG
jgi:hypothetical protein